LTTSSRTSAWRPATASKASVVGLDDQQQAHRLVQLDHLQRQARAQVALVAVHHPDRPVTLCGSLVPQPNTSLSTDEK
jgi:hypothetical protein